MSTSPAASTPPGTEFPPIAPASDRAFTLNTARLRTWGWKSFLALLDQGLTSGAGFLVNLLLARWLMPASYGAFAIAFAVFLFVSGFHNVLLLEPMSVIGPSKYANNLSQYFRAQFVIHLFLVGALMLTGLSGGLIAWRLAPDSPLVGAIFGGVIMSPLLLLLWLVRRMCYVLQRPGVALAGSTVYLISVIFGLIMLRHLGWSTPFFTFLLMGTASLVASAVLFLRIGISGSTQPPHNCSWRRALEENWNYGRWLLGSAVLLLASTQAQVFFVSAMIGLSAAGALRAVQTPSLVMIQMITAGGLLLLPVFSRDYASGAVEKLRRKAALTGISMAVVTLFFAAFIWSIDAPLERLLFGGKFAAYAGLMPLFVLVTTAGGASQGFGMGLRAAHKPHFDLIANASAAPIAIVSAYFFTKWWGLTGAVLSVTLAFAVQCVITTSCFYLLLPRGAQLGGSPVRKVPAERSVVTG